MRKIEWIAVAMLTLIFLAGPETVIGQGFPPDVDSLRMKSIETVWERFAVPAFENGEVSVSFRIHSRHYANSYVEVTSEPYEAGGVTIAGAGEATGPWRATQALDELCELWRVKHPDEGIITFTWLLGGGDVYGLRCRIRKDTEQFRSGFFWQY